MERIFNSASAEETEQIAESMGQQLKGGEVIQLVGDVGAGKTTFVKGLVRGMGSKDRVSSPSFTISNVYITPKLSLHHYDFYRITDTAIMKNELFEVINDSNNVVILEWAEPVSQVLPKVHIAIQIKVTNENSRTFFCKIPENYTYTLGTA